jgi:hypothetical protein
MGPGTIYSLAPFIRHVENVLFLTKWGLAPFIGTIYSPWQKQRVFLPCSLSLSSMVAASISQNLYPEHSS